VGLDPSSTDGQDELDENRIGEGFGGGGFDDRSNGGSETESKEGSGSDVVPPSKGLRVANFKCVFGAGAKRPQLSCCAR
jgi:hypothetical protein